MFAVKLRLFEKQKAKCKKARAARAEDDTSCFLPVAFQNAMGLTYKTNRVFVQKSVWKFRNLLYYFLAGYKQQFKIQLNIEAMEKIRENTLQQYPFDYFKSHLELIVEALAQSHDLSLMLKREGNQIFVYSPRRYSEQTNEILNSAKHEYQRKKNEGYSREQAFQDFMQAQHEMSQYLP